ncbi:MAG: hypothetical protein BGO43_05070 [Gammaproteobacteria bacterium 39-13]|nr:DNA-binding protein [Gammaproteobacteria bacterium]OJV96222.1 MAG: hypothetical protein BGO43_05070 [Gammaproteobacteria bacterium 39-13]
MGRIGVAYQDVDQAIEILLSKQKNLTVDNIREVLGTGSKSTIARHLKTWRENHSQNENESSLPLELLQSVKMLWERLQDQAEGSINQYQQEADNQIANMRTQLNEALLENNEFKLLIQQLESNYLAKMEESQQLAKMLNSEQNEKNKLIERMASFELRYQENKHELDRLHSLFKHAQDNLEHYQVATSQLRQEQTLLLEKQRNEYEQKNNELNNAITRITQEKSLALAQMEHLNQRYVELQREHQQMAQMLKTQQGDYQQLSLTHQSLEQMQYFLKEQYQQQADSLQIKTDLEIELRAQLTAIQEKANATVAALTKAEEKISSLQQEKETLFYQKINTEAELKQFQALLSKSVAQEIET